MQTSFNVSKALRRLPLVVAIGLAAALPATAQRGGPANVFVEPVATEAFSSQIEALGTLEPNERVDLTLNVADRVTAIFFDDGQRVAEGKTLLSLAQREQIALVEAAEATVAEARRQLERVQRLADENAVSRSELDEAQRDFDAAAAQLRAVQSRQNDRVLVAPFDGVLGFRQVSVGSFVRAGDVVATLIDDSEMNLDFSVPSTFLTAVQPGLVVEATSSDLPGMAFDGTVESVDNAIDPITRSVRVRAVLPNEDRALKAGMFMSVILSANPREALSIPEEAIEALGPKTFVWTVANDGGAQVARRVEVTVGRRQQGRVEILSGLEPSDLVITEGIIRVREGSAIRIRDRSLLQPTSAVGGGSSSGGAASSSSGQ